MQTRRGGASGQDTRSCDPEFGSTDRHSLSPSQGHGPINSCHHPSLLTG